MKRYFSVLVGLLLGAGCQHPAPARIAGPTLPLLQLTPEALGMKFVPPGAVTYSNRAWSHKPGMLVALAAMNKAVGTDLHFDRLLATKLVVVVSALNQCLY